MPTPPAISKLEREIEGLRQLRARALRNRQTALANGLTRRISGLQEQIRVLQRTPARSTGPSGRGSRDSKRKWFQIWKPKRSKAERKERKADRREKADRYAGVKITRENAVKLAAHYTVKAAQPFTTPGLRVYFLGRLREALRLKKGGSPRAAQRQQGAAQARRLAQVSRARKDYAAATQYDSRAERLEQQARVMEIQEGADGDDGEADAEIMQPRRPRLLRRMPRGRQDVPSRADDAASEADTAASQDASTDTEGTAEVEVPFYKRPAVWIGAAVAAAVLAVVLRGKGRPTSMGTMRIVGPSSAPPRVAFRASGPRPVRSTVE